MLVRLTTPPVNDRHAQYMDVALAAILAGNVRRYPISLIFARHHEQVGLYCEYPPELQALVERQLLGCYPECHLAPVEASVSIVPPNWLSATRYLELLPEVAPLRTYAEFEDRLNHIAADPLMSLLALVPTGRESAWHAEVRFTIRPATMRRSRAAEFDLTYLSSFTTPRRRTNIQAYASWAQSRQTGARLLAWSLGSVARRTSSIDRDPGMEAARAKSLQPHFELALSITLRCPPTERRAAEERLGQLAGSLVPFAAHPWSRFRITRRPLARPFLITTSELATLFHPPTTPVQTETLARVPFRELEPPSPLPTATDLSVVLGRTAFRTRRELVALPIDSRLRHLAVFGKTGMGKSTLLRNMIAADIRAGHGVMCVDPHGDLIDDVLRTIPSDRTNDLLLLDPADLAHPVAFNPLTCTDADHRPLVASSVLSAFKKLYGDSWGPRLEHLYRNALLALLEAPGSSLVSILPLFTDGTFRKRVLHHVRDPLVRNFWNREWAAMPPKFQAEAMSPVLNKVGHFVANPITRHILGQAEGTVDFRRLLDEKAIVLVKLGKGLIGEDASRLLGSLLITSLQIAAMSRADVQASKRSPFFLYVDEAHSFSSDAFSAILSEGRKYGLVFGALATQFLEQFDELTLASIIGNVGNHLTFALGQRDAEIVAEWLGNGVKPEDLTSLPRYTAYARILDQGQPSRPFSLTTLAPDRPPYKTQRLRVLTNRSRHRYSRPLDSVKKALADHLPLP